MQVTLNLDPTADATLIERLFDMFDVDPATRANPEAAAAALSLLTRHAFELLASGALDEVGADVSSTAESDTKVSLRREPGSAAAEAAMLEVAGAEHRSEIVNDGRGDPISVLAQDSDFVPLGKAHPAQVELELRIGAIYELLKRSASAKRLVATRRLTPDNNTFDEMVLHDLAGPIEVVAELNGIPHRFRIDAAGALVVGSLAEPPTPLTR